MDNSLFLIAGLALTILIIAVVLIVAHLQGKKRREALQVVALENGFNFTADAKAELDDLTLQASFDLFQRGHGRKVKNLLHGNRGRTGIAIFDYQYTTGSGKNSHTYRQTVLLLTEQDFALPKFFLRPEGIFDKIAVKLGQADINFDDRTFFSKKYRLTGEDETALRSAFNDALLTYFEQTLNLCVETSGSQMLVYTRGKLTRPEEITERTNQAIKLLGMLSLSSTPIL